MLPYRSFNALQTVGYREFFDYFDGTVTRDEAITLIKRNSRRYAKRRSHGFAAMRRFGGSHRSIRKASSPGSTPRAARGSTNSMVLPGDIGGRRIPVTVASRPLAPRVFHLVIAVAERIDGRADDVHDVVVGRGLRVEHPLAERLVHDDLRCGKRDASLLLRQQGDAARRPKPRSETSVSHAAV